jgi:hypothetical protein
VRRQSVNMHLPVRQFLDFKEERVK